MPAPYPEAVDTDKADVTKHKAAAPNAVEPEVLKTTAIATGGQAVARLSDGRVAFISGALADEDITVDITRTKKRYVHAKVSQIKKPSPNRITPECLHAKRAECGGCDWAHIAHKTQLGYKETIVTEQLQRLGGIENPNVQTSTCGNELADRHLAGRTTVRANVKDSRSSFYKRRSNTGFELTQCGAAHPVIEQILIAGRFANASTVTIRVGSATGEIIIITNGDPTGVDLSQVDLDSPGLLGRCLDVESSYNVSIVSSDEIGYHSEVIGGHRWRISSKSFFQTSAKGAEILVATVASIIERDSKKELKNVVDLYGGTGLLRAAVPAEKTLLASVEANPYSSADAKINLAETGARVINKRVENYELPAGVDIVIADPAREGLKVKGVATITNSEVTRLVLVSCDPASLGRDAALLKEAGWLYVDSQLVDMFRNTSRIEVVSHFERSSSC